MLSPQGAIVLIVRKIYLFVVSEPSVLSIWVIDTSSRKPFSLPIYTLTLYVSIYMSILNNALKVCVCMIRRAFLKRHFASSQFYLFKIWYEEDLKLPNFWNYRRKRMSFYSTRFLIYRWIKRQLITNKQIKNDSKIFLLPCQFRIWFI